jgi:hypothetical protein
VCAFIVCVVKGRERERVLSHFAYHLKYENNVKACGTSSSPCSQPAGKWSHTHTKYLIPLCIIFILLHHVWINFILCVRAKNERKVGGSSSERDIMCQSSHYKSAMVVWISNLFHNDMIILNSIAFRDRWAEKWRNFYSHFLGNSSSFLLLKRLFGNIFFNENKTICLMGKNENKNEWIVDRKIEINPLAVVAFNMTSHSLMLEVILSVFVSICFSLATEFFSSR